MSAATNGAPQLNRVSDWLYL